MEEYKKSLKSLFEQSKSTLSTKLESLSLPRDAQKVEDIVSCHLNDLLDSTGEYRQTLTQSEEFILLSAMNLLRAQQAMIGAVSIQYNKQNCSYNKEPAYTKKKENISKKHTPFIVGGTAIGGAAGALLFNTWGALFGAIAGTAIVLYYAANQESKTIKGQTSTGVKPSESKINVETFLAIVGNICENVDGIIETYRVQVRRIQNSYEQKEKPSLQNDYGMLLDQIANVCRVCEANKDSVPIKMQNAVGLLEESLENYGLNYDNGKISAI